jgi:hypothetical protein
MMLQIRPAEVAHFHPECLAQFTPVGVAHIVPESLAHYSPVEVVHFTPVCSSGRHYLDRTQRKALAW